MAVAGAAQVAAIGLGVGFEVCLGTGLLVGATACGLDTQGQGAVISRQMVSQASS